VEVNVAVQLKHAARHVGYVDVSMPPEALAMIRDNVEWLTPVVMVTKVQAAFPNVTAQQIHRAWTEMSEPFDDVDIFEPEDVPEGVEMLCWGMKKIAAPSGDTDNTNSKHLELYSIMAEQDGAGFPLSYLGLG